MVSLIICLTIGHLDIQIAIFPPHTSDLHQAIESIYYKTVSLWLLVIGESTLLPDDGPPVNSRNKILFKHNDEQLS